MAKTAALASQASKLSAPFTVALSQLWLSEEGNVRDRNSVSNDGIKQMSAMLLSQGQINPLVVSKTDGGQYTVHAGGRRLRGFWMLREQGKITDEHEVQVREIDPSVAVDISLVENLSQEPMHPVDEFMAFQRMVEKGQTPDQISKAFGCKVLHVKRRLKLASVAPELLQEFRKGEINLDQVMALAGCEDQERQVQIWKSLPSHQRSDQWIRRKIAEDEVEPDDDRLKLVSVDEYIAAGGAVREDLFSEKGKDQFLTDPALLDLLVAEKMEAFAVGIRDAGWAWVDVLPVFDFTVRRDYKEYPTVLLPENDDQRIRREAIEAEIAKLGEQIEALENGDDDDWWEKVQPLNEQVESLEDRVEAIKTERIDLNGVDMLIAGAVVYLDDGEIKCAKPLVRASDSAELKKVVAGKGSEANDGDDESGEAQNNTPVEQVSERLMTNLSAHRTAALQISLAKNQKVSLASLAACMASKQFRFGYHDDPVKVSMSYQWHTLEQSSPTMVQSPAYEELNVIKATWDARLPAESTELFAWFLQEPVETSVQMIAFCSATTVNALQGKNSTHVPAKELADAVSLDMAQWWEPTADNYLSLVPKSKMIEAVIDAKGEKAADGMDKMKKAEVIQHAEAALQGSGWLPSPLR